MSRWEPGTADRLRAAAIALFLERGFDATTVDDIAARVGVSQRTFFRHFVDKEEVLFDADAEMEKVLVDAAAAHLAAAAPTAAAGLAAARAAMTALARTFEAEQQAHRGRSAVLAQVPSLQGRQLVKQERWAQRVRAVLVDAGVALADAAAAVEVAAGALRLAYVDWLSGPPRRRLVTLLHATDARIDALTSR